MNIKPVNNNLLVEVLRDDDIARAGEGEAWQRGRILDASFDNLHITASAGYDTGVCSEIEERSELYALDNIVRWQEYAADGQTFEEDGKLYALVPWWRVTAVEVPDAK